MAQCDFAKVLSSAPVPELPAWEREAVPGTDVMTGDTDRSRQLLFQLRRSMSGAREIDLIVSFLIESGVRMICRDLKAALDRGARVRILTGNYLGITQPSALYLLKRELGDRVSLRFYSDPDRSFHPKSYLFRHEHYGELFLGSSNLSRSGLTDGIEWNYRLDSRRDGEAYARFCDTFEDLYANHSVIIDNEELRRYAKNWHRPAVCKDLDRYDGFGTDPDNVSPLYQPRGAQIEALCALEDSRAEGAEKGLVQAATGVGKTYLAAFDSLSFHRVLFVAHREEILRQAARSFANVRGSEDFGFFDGRHKDRDASMVFASVSTLGRREYLTPDWFSRDAFDYIVIDEFHHAVTDQYRRIVDYFQPAFLLGLTATPERMDGRDIYALCDYNVPYEISLNEAINRGILSAYRFFGIYDDTDYSGVRFVRGHYDEEELTRIYSGNKRRYDLIYRHYCKHPSTRALGFCVSRDHAEAMAREFCARGIPSAAVYSGEQGEYAMDREKAVSLLRSQKLRVLFCVDMFNEGLDIDNLDMVLFLRPTESPVVFFQQLGRGLRICPGKQYLTVLDFIGNYQRAGQIPGLLTGSGTDFAHTGDISERQDYPDDCLVDFDLHLLDLFREMREQRMPYRLRVQQEYRRVKDLLGGRVPTRMELFTYLEDSVYEYCVAHAKDNPFRHYLDFLRGLGELSPEEETLQAGIGREFLALLETTSMTKVYKMPILYSLWNGGDVRMEVTESQVLEAWKTFFDTGTNWRDLGEDLTLEQYRAMTDAQHLSRAKTMPIHFLKASGKGFFVDREGYAIALREELRPWVTQDAFRSHMGDILAYRTTEYYRRRYQKKANPQR